ncbi:serine/threonine-protein kinase [Mastigocladopsis repens]|uniref:serine/threonine-protein kinase n=1 Tax=Mastigocladopsis repens TaxID=221287 RepID=UPI00031D4C9D|nr:serine/threonine-protein kinase [Mastigocladopsis repens]
MTTKLLNNRYQVIQVLGAGGFGETFLAEDMHMPSRRRCVIKQLKPVTNDPQTYLVIQKRFEREAATLEYLGKGSEQIPELFAYFSERGQFYLVQEWIQGQTLGDIVKEQGVLSETTVKEILLSLLSVLDYVHSKGIIHRDIKPDNIIVSSSNGKPVLIDFGAVKETIRSVINPSGYLTQSLVIGTPGYMPSEQAIGRPVYATDIYSLGMTAIYLLTGKHPHELETQPQTGEVIWHHFAPEVSPNLAMVLNQAIKPHASDRYTTASKMLYGLKSATSLATVEPTAAAQPTVPLSPSAGASYPSHHTQPLSSNQKAPVISTSSTPANWQKSAWILGSLVVGSMIGAVAIASMSRQGSEVPIARSPVSTPLSEVNETNPTPPTASPTPTSEASTSRNRTVVAPPPVATAPNPPQQQQPETDRSAPPSVASNSQQESSTEPEPEEQEEPEESPTPRASTSEESTAEQQPTPQKEEQLATPPAPAPTPEASTPPPQQENAANTNTNSRNVPAFPVGSSEDAVKAALGNPRRVSRGAFGRTRAYLYQHDPNRVDLGYLFDRKTRVLRQTEVSFAPSVEPEVMQTTLQGMLGGNASGDIKQGLQQVYERKTNEYSFNVGELKGMIQRNSKDHIYIAVWDVDLHR